MEKIRRAVAWVISKIMGIAGPVLNWWHGPPAKRRPINQKRAGLWLLVTTMGIAVLILRDVSSLLGSIPSQADRSYDAGVLTGFKFLFWDTKEFAGALNVWSDANKPEFDVANLIRWHTLIDAIFFIPAYAALLGIMLRRVGASRTFATIFAVVLFAVDEIETLGSLIALLDLSASTATLIGIKLFSLIKWAVLAAGLVGIAILWTQEIDDSSTPSKWLGSVQIARSGATQPPAISVAGLVFLVGIYGALIALPAGGPLEQLPDVMRHHLASDDWSLRLFSVGALAIFAIAVALAGLISTSPRTAQVGNSDALPRIGVLLFAVATTVGLLGLGWKVDDRHNAAAYAPTLVIVVLSIAAWIADIARSDIAPPTPATTSDTPGEAGAPTEEGGAPTQESTTLVADSAAAAEEPEIESQDGQGAQGIVAEGDWAPNAAAWVAGLVGAIVSIAGLGLVRAAFSPYLLGLDVLPGGISWSCAFFGGILVAAAGAFVIWGCTELFTASFWRRFKKPLFIGSVAVVVVPSGWLMISPLAGKRWGSTGVVAVAFAIWALFIGLLTWVSRTRRHWDVPQRLGFGLRTPWLTVLVVTWVVASVLNTTGGYHDARVEDGLGPTLPRYADLSTAFAAWRAEEPEGCEDGSVDTTVPLILVAAPGGGIRAAYWTAAGLDRLFGATCATPLVFAISGVSGGSVGAATWTSSTVEDEEPSALAAVERMSEDQSLPGALASLLLRDVPQPLLGITEGWDDRAALLEDGWIESADVFGTLDKPESWAKVGGTEDSEDQNAWVPLVAMNGSSVNDGCRVLVSNVGSLPSTAASDCQIAPNAEFPASGPVSAAIDAFDGLYERSDDDHNCNLREGGMRTTTAALLSARFPLISPSGALLRCTRGNVETTTYSVDGGYYENSGLLTLLQIWAGIEDSVRAHNQSVSDSNTEPLGKTTIEPWIVVLDNHYRTQTKKAPQGRPPELSAIVTARGQEVLTQTMLEQVASFEMANVGEPCAAQEVSSGESSSAQPDQGHSHVITCATSERNHPGFVRIAPTVSPDVAAPLGWVLSPVSRRNLNVQLTERLNDPDLSLVCLLEKLGLSPSVPCE